MNRNEDFYDAVAFYLTLLAMIALFWFCAALIGGTL